MLGAPATREPLCQPELREAEPQTARARVALGLTHVAPPHRRLRACRRGRDPGTERHISFFSDIHASAMPIENADAREKLVGGLVVVPFELARLTAYGNLD